MNHRPLVQRPVPASSHRWGSRSRAVSAGRSEPARPDWTVNQLTARTRPGRTALAASAYGVGGSGSPAASRRRVERDRVSPYTAPAVRHRSRTRPPDARPRPDRDPKHRRGPVPDLLPQSGRAGHRPRRHAAAPRSLLLAAANRGLDPDRIAALYGVTTDMARYRYKTTGVAKQLGRRASADADVPCVSRTWSFVLYAAAR